MFTGFWGGGSHLVDPGIDGKIILNGSSGSGI